MDIEYSRNVTYRYYQISTKEHAEGVAVKPGLWTLDWTGLDWTGLDWTGLDSLREYAHCERIGGPRFFSFFCGDRDKSILFVLHFVYFLLFLPFFVPIWTSL